MADYLVKNGSTATGDAGRYTSAQTGSFASIGAAGAYPSITAAYAATTPPASGDRILVSNAHSFAAVAPITISSPTTGGFVEIISVSDTDVTQSAIGATEIANDGIDVIVTGRTYMYGMSLIAGDDWQMVEANTEVIADECIIGVEGTGDDFTVYGDGTSLSMINTELRIDGSTSVLGIRGGANLDMFGGRVQSAGNLLDTQFTNGGGSVRFEGVDLSLVSTYLVGNVGSSEIDDDLMDITFQSCKLNAGLTGILQEELCSYRHNVRAYNCGATAADAEYQFFEASFGGVVESVPNTGIHRDESDAFPSGAKVSMRVTTNARATAMTPFRFSLPGQRCSFATSAKVRTYFASTSTLTNRNFYTHMVYADGGDASTYNFLTSKNSNRLSGSTAHTDDSASSNWLNGGSALVGHNEYRLDLDTTSNPGANSVPIVKFHCGEPSATVYIDSQFDSVG